MGREVAVLSADIDRYISLRRTLGFKLVKTERHLRAYARHMVDHGETHLRSALMLEWVTAAGRTPAARCERLRALAGLARFLQAEDGGHEVPPAHVFIAPKTRRAT